MYFIPFGILVKSDAAFVASQDAQGLSTVDWAHFAESLVPVTLGNVIGGAVMVGAVYWLAYLRRTPA
jgi:formate/nitrite transporter FocA (FNT family)